MTPVSQNRRAGRIVVLDRLLPNCLFNTFRSTWDEGTTQLSETALYLRGLELPPTLFVSSSMAATAVKVALAAVD